MAYPTICVECLKDNHNNCLDSAWNKPEEVKNGKYPNGEYWCGAAICFCSHSAPEDRTPFEKGIWDQNNG